MPKPTTKKSNTKRPTKSFTLAGHRVSQSKARNIDVPAGESATGSPTTIPVRVRRGPVPGPTVAVTATVHGDEINGMGVVRRLLTRDDIALKRGTLVLAPVVNVLGFERGTRYMPDRRDLNRSFPGSKSGSLTARFAHAVFDQIVRHADYLIDLHSAASKRTNFPNVRADLDHPETARLADLFAAEITVHGKGPEGSLRRAAVDAGIPTIILEAGEVWKIEPGVTEVGVRGVLNVLSGLDMIAQKPKKPLYNATVRKTWWTRASHGGILQFHVTPGDEVEEGQPLATSTTLLGEELGVITADAPAIVLGMTTTPAVVPGDPVCHLAAPEGGIGPIQAARKKSRGETLDSRLRDELATNLILHDTDADTDEDETGV